MPLPSTNRSFTVSGLPTAVGQMPQRAAPRPAIDPNVLIQGGLGLASGVLSGIGQGKQAEAGRGLTREQILANFFENRQGDQRQRAQLGLQATQLDPLSQQRSRQQQALMAALLPEMRNFSVTAPNEQIAAKMPGMSGGFRLPEGGFSPETLGYFSPEARAAAEGNFSQAVSNVNPYVPAPTLPDLGYGTAGQTPTATAQAFQRRTLQEYLQENETQRQALIQALQEDGQQAYGQPPQKKSSGLWGKLGKVLLAGGAGALIPFTGGASAATIPAILSGAAAGGLGAASALR